MVGIISKTLSEVHPALRTNGMGIGNTHRRISLGVFPPNRKNPLVRKYNRKRPRREDQRSFVSLGEDFGSSVHEANLQLRDILEDEGTEGYYYAGEQDGGELSRTVSMPSRVSETPDLSPPDMEWLLQEHERRYSSAYNSNGEEEGDDRNGIMEFLQHPEAYDIESTAAENNDNSNGIEYEQFMHQLQLQKKAINNAIQEGNRGHARRRPSFVSVTTRGSVPAIYQEVPDTTSEEYKRLSTEVITFKSEAKILASYSFPLMFTFLLEQIFPLVCSLTVGHLGKTELAAVSLASMTSNITLAIFEGIATSLDTLCPQAYGSGRYHSVGVHLQRCILFSMVVYIPFALLWMNSEPILRKIVPEKELVSLTAQFLRVLVLGAPGYICFENLKRFLQAQGIFDAGIYVLTICAPLNIVVSYVLVWNRYIGVGFIGAAIAVVINFWLMFILLLLYAMYIDGWKCWGGFSSKAFTHWRDLGQLAISGIVMLEAEELSYEILTLFSAYFGTSYLAAQSAVSTMAALLYMVPFSIGIASSTRIANFIGAKRPDCAHISSKVGLSFSFGAGLVNCALLNLNKRRIAAMFSKDKEVICLITNLLPLVGFIQNFDALNAVAGSCLRGQGMQALGSIVNLAAYYLLAIPLGIFLGWGLNLKLKGLWIGIGCGMLLIGVIEAYFVLFPNWERIMVYSEMLKETADDDEEYDSGDTISDTEYDATDNHQEGQEPTERTRLLNR